METCQYCGTKHLLKEDCPNKQGEQKMNKQEQTWNQGLDLINQETKTCVLCKEEFKGYGNNAEPLMKGRCCDKCNNKLHDSRFVLENIEKDFLPRFREFYGSEEMRTCKKCGYVMPVDPRFV
jgi:hypothetical protein